jgi:hypothetical protein
MCCKVWKAVGTRKVALSNPSRALGETSSSVLDELESSLRDSLKSVGQFVETCAARLWRGRSTPESPAVAAEKGYGFIRTFQTDSERVFEKGVRVAD